MDKAGFWAHAFCAALNARVLLNDKGKPSQKSIEEGATISAQHADAATMEFEKRFPSAPAEVGAICDVCKGHTYLPAITKDGKTMCSRCVRNALIAGQPSSPTVEGINADFARLKALANAWDEEAKERQQNGTAPIPEVLARMERDTESADGADGEHPVAMPSALLNGRF